MLTSQRWGSHLSCAISVGEWSSTLFWEAGETGGECSEIDLFYSKPRKHQWSLSFLKVRPQWETLALSAPTPTSRTSLSPQRPKFWSKFGPWDLQIQPWAFRWPALARWHGEERFFLWCLVSLKLQRTSCNLKQKATGSPRGKSSSQWSTWSWVQDGKPSGN